MLIDTYFMWLSSFSRETREVSAPQQPSTTRLVVRSFIRSNAGHRTKCIHICIDRRWYQHHIIIYTNTHTVQIAQTANNFRVYEYFRNVWERGVKILNGFAWSQLGQYISNRDWAMRHVVALCSFSHSMPYTHTHRTQHSLTLWVNETTNIFINYKFSHHQTSSAPNRRWCVCRCVSCAVVCTAQMSQVNQMYEKQYCLWMANEFWDTINFYRVSLYACRWLMLSIAYHRTWLVGLLFFV